MVGAAGNRHFWVILALFCMLICIMSHIIRSVSDHGKYGNILKLSTVGVHSCVDLVVSVVAMATGATN